MKAHELAEHIAEKRLAKAHAIVRVLRRASAGLRIEPARITEWHMVQAALIAGVKKPSHATCALVRRMLSEDAITEVRARP
jgi:hypothetical protein